MYAIDIMATIAFPSVLPATLLMVIVSKGIMKASAKLETVILTTTVILWVATLNVIGSKLASWLISL